MTASARLAALIEQTRLEDLPSDALRFGRPAFLDTVGTIIASVNTEIARIAAEHARSLDAAPRSSVLGLGFKTAPGEAAFVNGTMGHALDMDDWGPSMWGHPSVPVVPAVLAVAEAEGRSGAEAIVAYILGVEVEGKIGLAGIGAHISRGWHSTGTLGTIAAAAAAARLLRLPAEQTQHALGIAATFGPDHTLAATLDSLANPWDIVSPGVGLKRYPCCSDIHPSLDAVLALRQERRIDAADIEMVEAHVIHRVPTPINRPEPKDTTDAMFSYHYCIAAALVDGALGPAQVQTDRFADPAIHDLTRRVRLTLDFQPNAPLGPFDVPARIAIHLRGGSTLTTAVQSARGSNENPFSREELLEKYQACTSRVLSPADISSTFDDLERIEQLPSLADLLDRLRAEPAMSLR